MVGGKGSEEKPYAGEKDPNPPTQPSTPTDPSTRERPFVVHLPVSAASVSSASAERKVDDLLRQVFRGKVPDKPLDLVDKLSQVIRTKKVEGRASPEYEYSSTPLSKTTGSTSGQSVAQTSLSERAQAALADAEKRLAALKPMQTPSDPENLDALRAVTLTTYKRLVSELAQGAGPRPTRADRHFAVLIGVQTGTDYELKPGSLLKQIEDSFKLAGAGVNTPEDSANVANFRIVKENLFAVFRSWNGFKGELEKDFSQLSGQFSRKLALIENEVTDVETAMDEAGFDATDRESREVKLTASADSEKITVDGLLSWLREFASEEGPELVEGGGGIGIAATLPTLDQLQKWVEALAGSPPVTDENVKASLDSLKKQVTEAKALAENITKPKP
jgi:hypothetical protein